MGGPKEKSHLEIVLDANRLVLKGTGVHVEPTRLSGAVVLHLAEPTSIRELTLQFRGKAKIPSPASDSLVGNSNSVSSVVCNHDWSFLEGNGRNAKTLKAGRHAFPFHFDITGALPSTIFSNSFGGASVSYKLRALAVRPGIMNNLSQIVPVTIMRTLTSEALEYQQSLEIENTWPEKLMYAIILPHKAWAGGDTLSAILKFSPLAKGVAVDNVITTICENTKVYTKGGAQDVTRVIATARHDIVNGRAVHALVRAQNPEPSTSHDEENQDVVTCVHIPVPRSTLFVPTTPVSLAPETPTAPESPAVVSPVQTAHANLSLPSAYSASVAPPTSTPSHSLEPINISHRVRWSIYIRNRDGHVSELRCSLPITILDTHFLNEAVDFSSPSRRLLFEASGLANELSLPGSSRLASDVGQDGDRDLPSYRAHVRDRVPNLAISCDNGSAAPNPRDFGLHSRSASASGTQFHSFIPSQPQSGYVTPARTSSHIGLNGLPMAQLPHAPRGGPSIPLDWVNLELSRLNIDERRQQGHRSQGSSRNSSARGSRANSRAPSPERRHHHEAPSPSNLAHDGHERQHPSRGFGSFFKATMKPFTSLTGNSHPASTTSPITSRPPSRGGHHRSDSSDAHPESPSSASHGHASLAFPSNPPNSHTSTPSTSTSTSVSTPSTSHQSSSELLFNPQILNEVPDYSTASRGFIGGVPPLSSLRGLPSYEEAQRHAVRSPTSPACAPVRRRGIIVRLEEEPEGDETSSSSEDGHAQSRIGGSRALTA